MLGHRKTSFVQWHSRARIDARRASAWAQFHSSENGRSRRLPIGAWFSQTLTSPFEYTTALRRPAVQGTTCRCCRAGELARRHAVARMTPTQRGSHGLHEPAVERHRLGGLAGAHMRVGKPIHRQAVSRVVCTMQRGDVVGVPLVHLLGRRLGDLRQLERRADVAEAARVRAHEDWVHHAPKKMTAGMPSLLIQRRSLSSPVYV